MKIWNSPAGELRLKRYPFAGEKSHQAWDAADELIAVRFPKQAQPVLIVGEAFGVLGTLWGKAKISALSDSFLEFEALNENRKLNPDRTEGTVSRIKSTQSEADQGEPAFFKKIIIRLPKSLELLDTYIRLSLKHAADGAEIWLGGMDKRWNRGVVGVTERLLETVTIFPFERHARWIQYRKKASADKMPAAARVSAIEWDLERYPISILSAPSVFSSAVLDSGTAAFVEDFPESAAETSTTIVDLGCGSGILGLCAAYNNPEAKVIFTDESFLAIENAKSNYELNKLSTEAVFLITNGAIGLADESVDLVLCNPPFHYQNIQSREPAEFLFNEARRILKPGGTIQIVGNSHLGYHKLLPNYFSLVKEVFRDNKFTVLRGIKTT